MPKVTIIIEDSPKGLEVHASFDEPGKTYEEMTANPSAAVAAGLAVIRGIQEASASYSGTLTDDDGTQRAITSENGESI